MDPVMIEKLQAKKNYFRKKRSFIHKLTRFLLSIFSIGMFLSCPLWLPKLHSFLSTVVFFSVKDLRAIVLGPKCLFLICNVIVMFLVGDSKRSAVPKTDIYEEYARRNKRIHIYSNTIDIRKEREKQVVEVEEEEEEEDEEMVYCPKEVEEDEEDEEMPKEMDYLPENDDLFMRSEILIAKMNRQRMLEARNDNGE